MIAKGHVRKNLSACSILIVLIPKKHDIVHMCMDNRAMNNNIIKYVYPILKLDAMLNELRGATIFSKVI